MAILTGINTKMRGSVGKYTFKRTNGQTIVSEKVDKKDIPVRTQAQMPIRMRWANLVAFWGTFTGNLRPSFQSRLRTRSDYNEFMSANLPTNPVFLPKEVAASGGCVVAEYQVTRGSLNSIQVEFNEGGVPVSDINLGGLTIGASTTVKAFSDAIIEHNHGEWKRGDQLSVFVSQQTVDPLTNVPRVKTECIEITLDPANDTQLLGDLFDANTFQALDGKLAYGGAVIGGIAFVHSRKTLSKTLVSTQFMVCSNPIAITYEGSEALATATLSYGGVNKEYFLTPNLEDLVPEVVVP